MEDEEKQKHDEIEIDEIPDEFQCCVCLELLYKPVVLGCGHIACFWCVYYSMDSLHESHCPICRHQYHHFPSICKLMHFLLMELYPIAYKRREMQVAEKENELGIVSPQFEDSTPEYCCKELSVKDQSSSHISTSMSSSKITADATENSNGRTKVTEGIPKPGLMTNLNCRICKQLLCRPVVLNCGHVYCDRCIVNQCDELCRCPVCQMEHPNGYPNVFLILDHFLEEQFPEEYASRKKTYLDKSDSQHKSISNGSQTTKKDGTSSSVSRYDYGAMLPGQRPKVHYDAGCDYCGMCPIVGDRYRCKDCKEKIGFDLCGACYNSPSKLPGRFNQQHTPEHKFELIETPEVNFIFIRDFQQLSVDFNELSPDQNSAPDDPENSDPSPVFLDDSGEDDNSAPDDPDNSEEGENFSDDHN